MLENEAIKTKLKVLTLGFLVSMVFNLAIIFLFILYSDLSQEIKKAIFKQQNIPTNININSQSIND